MQRAFGTWHRKQNPLAQICRFPSVLFSVQHMCLTECSSMIQLLCHLCGHEIGRNAVLNAANAKSFVNFIHQEIQQQVVVSSISHTFSGIFYRIH